MLYDRPPEAGVRDTGGNFYVTSVSAVAAIRKCSAAGTLLQSFLPGTRSDWMDLGVGQCTMYWDDEGTTSTIHRFNVCTGTALTASQISTFDTGNSSMFGLTMVGEITTGGPTSVPSAVPTVSELTLAALVLMLAGVAALRLRRRPPRV